MSTIVTDPLSRRSLLRKGAYGLALPFLDSVVSAAPTAPAPKRMIFLGGGYGFTDSYRHAKRGVFPLSASPKD